MFSSLDFPNILNQRTCFLRAYLRTHICETLGLYLPCSIINFSTCSPSKSKILMTACLELNTMPCTYTDGVSKKLYSSIWFWPKNKMWLQVLGQILLWLGSQSESHFQEELRNVILKMTSENLCTASIWISQFWPLPEDQTLWRVIHVGNVIVALVPKDAFFSSVSLPQLSLLHLIICL